MLDFYQNQIKVQTALANFLGTPSEDPNSKLLFNLIGIQLNRLHTLIQELEGPLYTTSPLEGDLSLFNVYCDNYVEQQKLLASTSTPEFVPFFLPDLFSPVEYELQTVNPADLSISNIEEPPLAPLTNYLGTFFSPPQPSSSNITSKQQNNSQQETPSFHSSPYSFLDDQSRSSSQLKRKRTSDSDMSSKKIQDENRHKELSAKKKLDNFTAEEKKEYRQISNRISARRSRQGKKEYVQSLEESVVQLSAIHKELETQCAQESAENLKLKEEWAYLTRLLNDADEPAQPSFLSLN